MVRAHPVTGVGPNMIEKVYTQYRAPGVRELFEAAATSGVPCMSIMNMAPLPYLKRTRTARFDTVTGKLTAPELVAETISPSFLAAHLAYIGAQLHRHAHARHPVFRQVARGLVDP